MIVMTFANEKGGVGKTTVAVTIAAGMAARGKRVVLIDADAQGTATWSLGLKKEPCFYDLLVRDAEWNQVLRVVPPERYGIVGTAGSEQQGLLAVLPGNSETSLISSKVDKIDLIAERLDQLTGHVDAVIFDTSPTPSLLHGVIYLATDVLIYPAICEVFSLNGLLDTIRNRATFDKTRQNMLGKEIVMGGIIPTMYQANTIEHSVNRDELEKRYGDLVWKPVAKRITWSEAAAQRVPVYNFDPGSQAAADAWELIDRAMEVFAYV